MAAPYMPLYVADFQADTVHLDGHEAGAYMLLLMAMWRAGGSLDADETKLARYAKLTTGQWQRVRVNVMPFFQPTEGQPAKITQPRLARELEKYTVAVDTRAARASKGGKAKALKNNNRRVLEADFSTASAMPGLANKNQNQSQNVEGISNKMPSTFGVNDHAKSVRAWSGPAEIRDFVVAARDEAFAVRYIDGATWDGTPGHEAVIVKSQGAAAVLGALRGWSWAIRVCEARAA